MLDGIICIPTHMREKLQTSIKFIDESLHKNVYFFTDESRVDLLSKEIPKDCTIIPVPSELGAGGIATKRQFIVDWSNSNGFNKIWQIDDKMVFCKNTGLHPSLKKGPQLLRYTDTKELVPLIEDLFEKLDTYPMVGNLNRSGTYQQRIKFENVFADIENARMYSSLGVNAKFFKDNDIRFDYLQRKYSDLSLSLMEDYAVLLQLLTKGHKVLQLGKFSFDKTSGSTNGGCYVERNGERQKRVSQALEKEFPEYVKAVLAPSEWESMDEKWNVRISWSKFKEEKTQQTTTLEDW